MITREEDVDIHALRRQGWTITAIANHVGRDRKTVRDYLNGKREPGVRKRADDPFAPFVDYVTARLVEDPHLWAITLFDELEALGFTASYQTLTRQIRARNLRPACAECGRVTERANAVIPHPAGEETQWDWLDLPDPPAAWGWGSMAHLLVGSLAHSGRWRGYLSPSMHQPHLVEGPGPDHPRPGWGHEAVAVRPGNDKFVWPHCAGLIWPHPQGLCLLRWSLLIMVCVALLS